MEIRNFDDSIEKFIKSLEKQTIAKVLHTIDLLEEFGHQLGMLQRRKLTRPLLSCALLTDITYKLYLFYEKL